MSIYDSMSIDDVVNFHVNHQAHDALRYRIFDIGKILLRTDTDGERNKKWRQMVHSYLDREVKTFFRVEDTTARCCEWPDRYSDLITTFFQCTERWLMEMGKAVLDPDQHQFYLDELGAALGQVQREICHAIALKYLDKSENFYDMNGVRVHTRATCDDFIFNDLYDYSKIKWNSYLCNYAISRPQHNYSVQEELNKLENSPMPVPA